MENRCPLTGWQNEFLPTDVDGQNGTTTLDALLVINELDIAQFSNPANGIVPQRRDDNAPRVDVNNDRIVSALDALLVINAVEWLSYTFPSRVTNPSAMGVS